MFTPEEIKTFVLGADPYVLIRLPQKEDGGFDVKVKADGVDGQDELAIALLLVVESITSDLYVEQVDIVRRAAGLGPLTVGADQ